MSSQTEQSTRNSGYTYWKRDIADSHLIPNCEPKRIEHSSSEESLQSGYLASRWNSGTTYEEKNITDRARRILTDLIHASDLSGEPLSFSNMKGEVHAHIVRGKPKIGYEIETLTIHLPDEEVILIEDIDSTDPDGFKITAKKNEGELKNLITKLMKDMTNKLLSE